jgi:hypothetical protein
MVQLFQKNKIGKLLDNGERIGDSAGPEVVPYSIDLRFYFACNHFLILIEGKNKDKACNWEKKRGG